MDKPLKRVAVTGGAGQIAYSLLFRIAHGDMLGDDQPIALHILELPVAIQAAHGVVMELEDCAFPLLKEIRLGSDPQEIFADVDYALLVGAKPRGPGMERRDLLQENAKTFIEQGLALDQVAHPDVKVLVVGNPCNTNCFIAMSCAKRLFRKNFFAMTRLDQNRAVAELARKAQVDVTEVSHMTIWGNHSATQVPDFYNAQINQQPALQVIDDEAWLKGEFIKNVQQRGAAIIAARGKSSAASAANAAIDTMRDLLQPTPEGEWYSLAMIAEGNPYGIDPRLIFSFPVRTTKNGAIEIVSNLSLNDFLQEKIALTEKELIEERDAVSALLKK